MRCLIAIADNKSINKASSDMYTTPQNVSRLLKQMEDEMGFELVIRKPSGITFTKLGEEVLDVSRQTISRLESIKQKFENGYQVEQADSWQGEESPWQFARRDRIVKIPLYGNVEVINNPDGSKDFLWMNTKTIYGVPFDFPIVGYNGKSVNYLRLFSAKTDDELDINVFNEGGYIEAMKEKIETLRAEIEKAILSKPQTHEFACGYGSFHGMNKIGG